MLGVGEGGLRAIGEGIIAGEPVVVVVVVVAVVFVVTDRAPDISVDY
jgi:hypothetical protein